MQSKPKPNHKLLPSHKKSSMAIMSASKSKSKKQKEITISPSPSCDSMLKSASPSESNKILSSESNLDPLESNYSYSPSYVSSGEEDEAFRDILFLKATLGILENEEIIDSYDPNGLKIAQDQNCEDIENSKSLSPLKKTLITSNIEFGEGEDAPSRKHRKRRYFESEDQSINCFRCGKHGHMSYECTDETFCNLCKKIGHSDELCPRENFLRNMQCYKCGRFGHAKINCPNNRNTFRNHNFERDSSRRYEGGRFGHNNRIEKSSDSNEIVYRGQKNYRRGYESSQYRSSRRGRGFG